ncbi:hypothetical protein [Propioniciclava flava]
MATVARTSDASCFSTYTNEVPERCVSSVLELRRFFTEVIGEAEVAKN